MRGKARSQEENEGEGGRYVRASVCAFVYVGRA